MTDQNRPDGASLVEGTDEFVGSSALITGGASGIGRATSILLAKRGSLVTIADRDVLSAERTVAEINASGGSARFIRCDVADEDEVSFAVSTAMEFGGRLDYAANCAGLRGPGMPVPMAEYDSELFDRLVAVNLRGSFLCLKYELAAMIPNGRGSIVNISSGAGVFGVPGTAGYSSSKHGIIGLTKTAALDYAGVGIRVNVICPGLIDTPMNQTGRTEEHMMAMINSIPLGRKGEASEVADAIVWLCSSHSSFVTGSVIGIDGGRSALR